MHHDDKRSFSTEKIDEKLEEGINGESLEQSQRPGQTNSLISATS